MARQVRRTAGTDLFLIRFVSIRFVGMVFVGMVSVGSLLVFASTAAAAVSTSAAGDTKTVVVVTGDVRVATSDRVDNLIVVNGDVQVAGVAEGAVFVVNGNVVVSGRVHGDVTSLNGRVTLTSDASVGGDVVSKDPARIADGAHVGGDVARASNRFALGRLGAIGRVFLWVAATVSSFLLGAALLLLVPRGMDSVVAAGRTAIGPVIGLGFAVVFGVPVAGIILAVTVLGLPLGLAVLLGLALLYGIGYAAGALVVGRTMVRRKSRWLAFLAGWGVLRVIAIIPVLGVLVLFATVVYGLG
ncbi:MAG: hypothetical protein ACHQIG_13895, partial [Acidimicrobiia bacterium]